MEADNHQLWFLSWLHPCCYSSWLSSAALASFEIECAPFTIRTRSLWKQGLLSGCSTYWLTTARVWCIMWLLCLRLGCCHCTYCYQDRERYLCYYNYTCGLHRSSLAAGWALWRSIHHRTMSPLNCQTSCPPNPFLHRPSLQHSRITAPNGFCHSCNNLPTCRKQSLIFSLYVFTVNHSLYCSCSM